MASAQNLSVERLLAAPYRDRQLVAILGPSEAAVEPVSFSLDDYLGAAAYRRNLDPRNWITKDFWTDPRSYGLIGYAFDRMRGRVKSSGSEPTRYLQKIPADAAERVLSFPPGHPLYDTVYAGHPLIPTVYVPVASFHRWLFEEKFNELLTLLWSLGASNVAISHVRGYRDAFEAKAGLSLPAGLPVELSAGGKREQSQSSEAMLHARFTPQGAPHLPKSPVWFGHEPTWKSIAEARLTAGLREINVELRYDDDYGVSLNLVAKLHDFGFKLGGDFERHERTAWKFHGTFA
jgi:hypothetical protein